MENQYYIEEEKSTSGELKSDGDSPDDVARRRNKKKRSHRKERRRSSVSSDGRPSTTRDERRHRRKHHHRRSSTSRSRSRSIDKRRRRRRNHRSRSTDSRDSVYSWGSSDYGSRWDDKPTDSYKYQVPNNTIMIRGLAPHLTENDIRQDLLKCGILVKDIRLIRHRDTGSSRGFAFVEFHTVSDAIRWMEAKKGVLVIHDQYESNLIYSVPKIGNMDGHLGKCSSDWYCGKCRAYNFKRRDLCYKCNEPRPPDQDSEISNEISSNPTNTIMLFALDALTTEETVLQAFQSRASLASLPIRSVRIARESGTNLSKGICYVESNNIADAMRLFSAFTREALEIDNRKIQAAYYKIPTAPAQNSAAASALAAAKWTNSSVTSDFSKVVDDVERMAEYSATLYAKSKEEHASFLEYYRNYYRNEADNKNRDKETVTKSSVEVSCASTVNKRVEFAASGPQSTVNWTDPKSSEVPKVPDKDRCQFDESTGYYYYPDSGYYYDPATQRYYDPEKQQFLQWDSELKKHKVVPSGLTFISECEKVDKYDADKRTKAKKTGLPDKVKVAKNVAKDMEKWAKNLNQKKEYRYGGVFDSDVAQGFGKWSKIDSPCDPSTSQNKSIFSDSAMTETTEMKLEEIPVYDNDVPFQENDESPDPTDSRFIDMQKIACLLCKRQFSTLEVLLKHANLSDLHKQNLSVALGRQNADFSSGNLNKTYRDRAQERRMKFGTQADVASNSLKDLYMKVKKDIVTTYVEEPTKQGIKQDNIGNRMLQKMGWMEGQGLGKDNRGIVDPITAERRIGKHGLGLDIPGGDVEESDDRQTKARKLTLARYMKLE